MTYVDLVVTLVFAWFWFGFLVALPSFGGRYRGRVLLKMTVASLVAFIPRVRNWILR